MSRRLPDQVAPLLVVVGIEPSSSRSSPPVYPRTALLPVAARL